MIALGIEEICLLQVGYDDSVGMPPKINIVAIELEEALAPEEEFLEIVLPPKTSAWADFLNHIKAVDKEIMALTSQNGGK